MPRALSSENWWLECAGWPRGLGNWDVGVQGFPTGSGARLELGELVVGVRRVAQVHEDARGLLQLHQALEHAQQRQLRPHAHLRQLPPPAHRWRALHIQERTNTQVALLRK